MQHSWGRGQGPGVGSGWQEAALKFCVPFWLAGSLYPWGLQCLLGAYTHLEVQSLSSLSCVRRDTGSEDTGQHRNARSPRRWWSCSSPQKFLNLVGKRKGLRVLELPIQPLLLPLPAHSWAKQETRLGCLPGPRLGQEVQETSEKDPPQHRRRLLRNPWEGKINPAPAEQSPRGGRDWNCVYSPAWPSVALTGFTELRPRSFIRKDSAASVRTHSK